jgi:hypothetical protein
VATLGWVILASWVVWSAMTVGYELAGRKLPRKPIPFLVVGAFFEVAAVWLALKVIL